MVDDDPRSERVSPVFVGRAEALDLAVRRWTASVDGPGHMLLVIGEAGIGKSRLVSEFVSRLSGGPAVVDAASFPRDAQAAGAVMFALAEGFSRAGLTDVATTLRARLLATDAGGDGARRRRLLVGDLAAVIVAALARRATLVRIEDLHWADELSLDVLDRLAHSLQTVRGMILITARSDELASVSALGAWRSRLLSGRVAEEVRLPRLEAADTALVVEAILGAPPSSDYLADLQDRSDGIPLHIEELLAGGSLDSVPDTLAHSVMSRVDTLDPAGRAVLEAASVIGRSFDLDLLSDVTSSSVADLDAALAELMSAHLLVTTHALMVFRHALLCDVVYAHVLPLRRRALHSAVADAAVVGGLSESYISDHYEKARDTGRAYEHALAGALEAVRISAHREAAELYARAIRTVPRDLPARDRAALDAACAAERAAIDDNAGAAECLEAAIESYRAAGAESAAAALVPQLMSARHLLGVGLWKRAALAHVALARLEGDDGPAAIAARAHLFAALAAAHMLDRSLDAALDFAQRATGVVAHPESVGDLDATLGAVLVFAGRSTEGWSMLESVIADSAAAGLEAVTARGYRMLGTSASVLVEYDRADRWIGEGLDFARRTERWNDLYYLTAHDSHVLWARGHLADSEAQARDALARGRGITTRITAIVVLGYVALSRGQLGLARDRLGEALALAAPMAELQRVSPALWGLSEVALHEGDAARAIELGERAFDGSLAVRDAAYLFPFVVTITRAHLVLRDPTSASHWLERCRALVESRKIPGTLASLVHAEGLILLAAGQTGTARTLLEAAGREWDARDRAWEGGQVLLDLAQCAVRSRRPADAQRLLAEARRRGGSGSLLESLADDLADPLAVGTSDGGPLSAREHEVAALVASGLTNREIAVRLVISPRTASTHVEHILAKLGASRRAEIAAWIARHD